MSSSRACARTATATVPCCVRSVGTDRLHQRWLSLARRAFSARTPDVEQTDQRHDLIEQLGDAVIGLRTAIGAHQDADQRLLEWILVLLSAGVTLIAGGVGGFVAGRRERRGVARDQRERRYPRDPGEFAEAMQVAQTSPRRTASSAAPRAHDRRAAVVVLNRNNSADRLEAATPLPTDSPLAEPLGARRAAQLPRRAPQPRPRARRRGDEIMHAASSAAARRASRPASRCSSAARSSARCSSSTPRPLDATPSAAASTTP